MKPTRNRISLPLMGRFVLCAGLLGAGVMACDDPPPDPIVTVGSSDDPIRHGTITDGATVWITYGLQGGHHIWGSLRAEHVDPHDVRMQFGLFVGDEQIGGADYRDDLRRAPAGPYEYGGVTVFIYDDIPVESLAGQSIEMTLRLTDGAGRTAEDRVLVVARCCE